MAPLPRCVSRLLAALILFTLCQAALADPPGRVGRLADVQGSVWLYDAETAEWVAAGRNRPLTTGDRVSTDGNGRAELRVGSTALRLDAGTEIEVLQLDDDIVRVQLHNGLLALRLRTHEAAREFELITAEGRFKPDRAGRYRLDRIDATSSITVWSGQLLFQAPDNAVTLSAGQRADISSINNRTQYTLVQPQRDAFADEVAAAEQADERSVSARYVSPEMTGVEELDRHGRWENDTEYGALWVPRAVVPGWAPYRFGHWAWVRPWGWTWVDDASWGFAPFHYGRWVFLRNTWCWSPGQWVARPVYAPALVAWVGAPVGVAIGVGPSVGWFPLGPREVFVPGYRSSPTYIRNVNVTQVTNITNITNIINAPNSVVGQTNYINRGVPGAVTVVPASVVSGRQPVAPARVQLTDPRPGRGDRDLHVAALPTVTAAPQIQPPPPPHGAGTLRPPGAAPGTGSQNQAGTGGAAAPLPTKPSGATPLPTTAPTPAPVRDAVPAPPMTQPVVRSPRPAGQPESPVGGAPRSPAGSVPSVPPATATATATALTPAPAPAPARPMPVEAQPPRAVAPTATNPAVPRPAPGPGAVQPPRAQPQPQPPIPVAMPSKPPPAPAAPPPRVAQPAPAMPPPAAPPPAAVPQQPKAPPVAEPRAREPKEAPRETGKIEK